MKRRRNTKQRRMVFDAVRVHGDHPSADQVYLWLKAQNPKISRATVYRNLHLLVENSELSHVKIPGVDRFDWRTEPHYHLRCMRCGKICDAPLPYVFELNEQLQSRAGCPISGHHTLFEGVCQACLAQQNAQQ